MITGPREVGDPQISPDGNWVLYGRGAKKVGGSAPQRLMRIPIGRWRAAVCAGNAKRMGHECARAPASLCAILEESQDGKEMTVTAFDPLKGRGKVLRTIEKEKQPADDFAFGLSPDGTTFAIAKKRRARDSHSLAFPIRWL